MSSETPDSPPESVPRCCIAIGGGLDALHGGKSVCLRVTSIGETAHRRAGGILAAEPRHPRKTWMLGSGRHGQAQDWEKHPP